MANYLITGGCGFVGSHIVQKLLDDGNYVTVIDNLSRPGSSDTAERLSAQGADIHIVDVSVKSVLDNVVAMAAKRGLSGVAHLAGQVAVTTSVSNPIQDMHTNVNGTVYLLEAIRRYCPNQPVFVFASTNKVYGHLDRVFLSDTPDHGYRPYMAVDQQGISEKEPVDFYSPYGCSKGAADQYVRDYFRIYGMPTVVFRKSCICGPAQLGLEDQGWVAWLAIAAALRKSITIYGDGKQVRDVLYVNDIADLYCKALYTYPDVPNDVAGEVFNVGGGPENTMSLLELVELLKKRLPEFVVKFSGWRPGDQKWYVTDISKVTRVFNWKPTTSKEQGVDNILKWVKEKESYIRSVLPQHILGG